MYEVLPTKYNFQSKTYIPDNFDFNPSTGKSDLYRKQHINTLL